MPSLPTLLTEILLPKTGSLGDSPTPAYAFIFTNGGHPALDLLLLSCPHIVLPTMWKLGWGTLPPPMVGTL